VVAGAQRGRLGRLLDALARQSAVAEIEVVVVDTNPDASPPSPRHGLGVEILPCAGVSFGQARAAAARAARGDLVAFLEDHCYPCAGWAQAVIDAGRQPCAAIGYAIANANPESRVSQAVHLATYGEWHSPRAGVTSALPGGNVAYRREVLIGLGDRLAGMLQADYNLHRWMLERGMRMIVEPRARAEHESEERLRDALRSSFVYSRVLAAQRAKDGGWSARTRALVAGKDLLAAPVARLHRLLADLPAELRSPLHLNLHLPGVLALYLVSAAGEAFGYLAGEGHAAERLMHWEVDAPRTRTRA
jgi:hypothetical protein